MKVSETEDFNFELKIGIGRDSTTGTSLSIGQFRRADNEGSFTKTHSADDFIPAFNNLTNTEVEGERLVSVVTCIELLARFRKSSSVVYGDLFTLGRVVLVITSSDLVVAEFTNEILILGSGYSKKRDYKAQLFRDGVYAFEQ